MSWSPQRWNSLNFHMIAITNPDCQSQPAFIVRTRCDDIRTVKTHSGPTGPRQIGYENPPLIIGSVL